MGENFTMKTLHMLAWFVGINLSLSILLLLLMYKYPKYIIYAYNRLHVIALDLPGHGDSSHKDKDDLSIMSFVHHIKKFSDLLHISDTDMHLLGISLGGRIAGMYAATYPKELTSIILVCPQGIKNKPQTMFAEEFKQTKKFALLPDTADEYINMINMAVHKPIKIPQLIAEGLMQIGNSKLLIYTQVAENMLDCHYIFERNIENITTPMFLIWGIEDKIIDVSCVDVIKSKLPSTLKKELLLSECGHGVLLEMPRKSAKEIVEYLHSFYM